MESTGAIQTPGYPDGYENYMECVWTITSASNLIKLDFTWFEVSDDFIEFHTKYLRNYCSQSQFYLCHCQTEGSYDFFYVYDGDSESAANILSQTSGTVETPFSVTSSGFSLTLKFTSDGSETRPGVALTFSPGKKS